MSNEIGGIRNFKGAAAIGNYEVSDIQKNQDRVLKVAQGVLSELHQPTHASSDPEKEIRDLSQLISSIEKADQKLEEGNQTRIFKRALFELKEAREQLKSAHPREINKGHASRIKELKRNVMEQIKQLPPTLKTPEERKKLYAIQKDILKLKDLGESNLDDLEKAIACLIDPSQFGVSREEELLVARLLANKSIPPGIGDSYKQETEAVSLEKAQEVIIEALKDCCTSSKTFESMAEKSKGATIGIFERVIVFRFKRFARIHKKQGMQIRENFILNTPRVIKALQIYRDEVSGKLQEAREEILQKLYQKVTEQPGAITWKAFQDFLGTYPRANMATIIPAIVQEAQEDILQQFNVEGDDVLSQLSKQIDIQTNTALQSFENSAKAVYPAQLWLARNFVRDHISKPYSQGTDVHGNLGFGVCFANAAERSALLLNKPGTPNQEIQMGSTSSSRMVQSRYLMNKRDTASSAQVMRSFGLKTEITKIFVIKEYYDLLTTRVERLKNKIKDGRQAKLNNSELQELKKDLEEAELALDVARSAILAKQPLVERKELTNMILNELTNQLAQGNQLFIVELLRSGGGHAINLQINPELGIYRFMDDNVGLCVYEDLKQLATNLAMLVNMYYGDSYYDTICLSVASSADA